MAANLDLPAVDKGATYRHTLIWKDKLKVPINLTSTTARMQIRESVDSGAVILDLNTTSGGITLEPLLGKISLYMSNVTTSALVGYGGVYDLEVSFPLGDVVRLIEGSIEFIPEVTR